MDMFSFTTGVLKNTARFEIRKHVIRDFSPVNELIRETRNCFHELKTVEDDSAGQLKWLIWRLRQLIVLSISPFSSPLLRIEETSHEIEQTAKYFSNIVESTDKIRKIAQFLLENPENPKGKQVEMLIAEAVETDMELGIVTALTRGWTPGLEDSYTSEIGGAYPACLFVSSAKILNNNLLDNIILPSNGRYSPLMYNLVFGGRTGQLDIVAYESEQIRLPSKRLLPMGGKHIKAPSSPKQLTDSALTDEDVRTDDWEQTGFWSALRPTSLVKKDFDRDLQYVVRARMILLADNSYVFLKEDQKVIELSNFIESRTFLDARHKTFPRTMTSDLEINDMIVLRTSGSGTYLDDVANTLMLKDGMSDLASTALEWKPFLKKALETHGSNRIMELLRSRGVDLCVHQYLWTWTTNEVISPGTDAKFFELIAILDDLGYLPPGINPVEYASSKWQSMKKFKEYRHKAGSQIRISLMNEMGRIIENGVKIGGRFDLSLKGVSAGTISIFRVAGVDPEAVDVPYSDIGILREMNNLSWHE